MPLADPPVDAVADGLLVLLPERPGGRWIWWRVNEGALGERHHYSPDEGDIWDLGEGARVVALVPSTLAPVRARPRGDLPLAQALAAARLEAGSAHGEGWEATGLHVAVASEADRILVATAATGEMDKWLAELAAAGIVPAAMIPAALALPRSDRPVTAEIEGQLLARTADAAFAGEPGLLEALAGSNAETLVEATLDDALLAAWQTPPLDLRQGPYAPRRVSFFRLPDWVQLARMAAVAALLGLLVLVVETVKLNWDASAREQAALADAQKRFPAAVDLASAQSLATAELTRRGAGGGSFPASASAVLAALRPIPSLTLREMGYAADGTLRVQASAPTADAVNQFLATLQRDGWQVTVPPSLAPDPTGATVAAITVRAP